MLELRGLNKAFADGNGGRIAVLRDASLAIAPGETVALTGESGSGKSTALHICAGLEPPDSGEVLIDGVALSGLGDGARAALRRDRIGLVFQQFNLIPALDARANLEFQAKLAGRFDADWCAALTERLGLSDVLNRYPEQLSGGQQQRVAIGRALAGRPGLILADEPTGNLDEAGSTAVMALFLDLVAETGAALLMVTHSERLAARLGRRLRLSGGRLAQ